jgi:hypothetical protein
MEIVGGNKKQELSPLFLPCEFQGFDADKAI